LCLSWTASVGDPHDHGLLAAVADSVVQDRDHATVRRYDNLCNTPMAAIVPRRTVNADDRRHAVQRDFKRDGRRSGGSGMLCRSITPPSSQ